VRIAGLLGFSMLLGASTCAPGLPRIAAGPEQRALTGSRRETAVRCAWTAIASPANPSNARASRHRQARARRRTLLRHEANIMIMLARRRRRPLTGIQFLAERPFTGVLHRVSRRVIRMAGRTRGVITRDSVGTDVPAVARNRVAGSVNVGHRNRNALRWTGPVRRDARSKKERR
jgi:hypothetical protein